ncbi:type II toxin-antitoxin system RelE/ParE family toxin [Kamptonema sp. UHCC 0994]|uniref:type II toxin-antitoxin system RelE/ParE family toxin n=1 Tax=Kamptonema sp. UHCC 0994 TaxID=3031329 RepID=UPI0023B93229|nr:type II toxin-antitoxin system RelE/ParE family toxin [Kamptonema sp. UHCC 0994]MDF0553027.1 type II toxin-antitoxin system RelE/ParE family toxin [Kamptonema sp. UHCC 0994]
MEVQPREIQTYETNEGRIPFEEWLDSLRDREGKAKIKGRLQRIALANLGDCKLVGENVVELRIDYGPGYRVYFGEIGSTVVLLLCGGDKSTQDRDIRKAKEYWIEFRSRDNA